MPEDPFDLLGLPARFDLEPGAIQRGYLKRAGTLGAESGGDERWAQLNDARAAVADPERRANLLLARMGGPRPDQERSLPPDFLAEMMEVRENIEAAIGTGDPAEAERWRAWARQRRRSLIEEVGALLARAAPAPDPDSLRALRIKLNAWRYIERLVEQLEV